MSRTPNDDRSDTMNPNNDAYLADQENRFGGLDDDDDRVGEVGGDDSPGRTERDRDPHAELRRKLELAYATRESEERDDREARAGFLRWAEEVMTVAADVATKQRFGGRVIKGDGFVELALGNGRRVRVADFPEHTLIDIGEVDADGEVEERRFGYAQMKWRTKRPVRVGDLVLYQFVDERSSGHDDPRALLLHALEECGRSTLAVLQHTIAAGEEVAEFPATDDNNPY